MLSDSLWIAWFLVGISFLWVDLAYKVRLGNLSIAAFVTVWTSFFVPLASQLLVFCFIAGIIVAAEHAHKGHQSRLKHHFVH